MLPKRPGLTRCRYGQLTQGTIFSCARSHRYTTSAVFGLTITARCDVAQQKYPVLNYLPVVPLNDWLHGDGLDILIEQHTNEVAGTLRALLRKGHLSEAALESTSVKTLVAAHFLDPNNKSQRNLANELLRASETADAFQALVGKKDSPAILTWLRTNSPAKVSDLIRRLSKHSVSGYYFLETIHPDDSTPSGYVCLLREVATLPKRIAEKIATGLDATTLAQLNAGHQATPPPLTIAIDDLAMPIAQLTSPTIEHILQAFSHLFGRIGISDPDEQVIKSVIQLHL